MKTTQFILSSRDDMTVYATPHSATMLTKNFTIYNFPDSQEIHLKLAHFNWIVGKCAPICSFVHSRIHANEIIKYRNYCLKHHSIIASAFIPMNCWSRMERQAYAEHFKKLLKWWCIEHSFETNLIWRCVHCSGFSFVKVN